MTAAEDVVPTVVDLLAAHGFPHHQLVAHDGDVIMVAGFATTEAMAAGHAQATDVARLRSALVRVAGLIGPDSTEVDRCEARQVAASALAAVGEPAEPGPPVDLHGLLHTEAFDRAADADDGRGIDLEAVRADALAHGETWEGQEDGTAASQVLASMRKASTLPATDGAEVGPWERFAAGGAR